MRRHSFSVASAVVAFALTPAWIDFWWRQRAWASKGFTLAGAPLLVLLAVALAAVGRRRGERFAGWMMVAVAAIPLGVFVWMNFFE